MRDPFRAAPPVPEGSVIQDFEEPTLKEPPSADGDGYRSMEGRGRVVMILLALCVLIAIVAVFSDLQERSLLDRIERGDFASEAELVAEANASDNRQRTIGRIQIAVGLITGIAFIAWFHGAYKNVRKLGRHPRFSEGWAIGGWFVPFLNLARPKSIADDIYRASDPMFTDSQREAWRGSPVSPLLHAWWAGWIASFFLWRFSLAAEGDTLESIQTASTLTLLADLTEALTGVLAIAVVFLLTVRQEEHHDRLLQSSATRS